jgi:hypothetical protein
MTDEITKMMEEQRKELVAAGEIGPDEKLSLREISKRYTLYMIKQSQGGAKGIGSTEPKKKDSVEAKAIEDARQLFLDNPELLAKIQAAARGEISAATAKGEKRASPKSQKMGKAAGVPDIGADAAASKLATGEEKPTIEPNKSKPFEGLVYAVEQLIAQGKEGYNACLLVVDGCWVSVSYKLKRKQIYIQVAGDKYIPKKSALKPEHVKILEGMKIQREEGSIDIFSIYHDLATMDIPRIARDVSRIFDEVLRVSKGAVAYLQFDLVSKPTPEYEAVLAKIAEFIPDKREKKKFYWKWGSS